MSPGRQAQRAAVLTEILGALLLLGSRARWDRIGQAVVRRFGLLSSALLADAFELGLECGFFVQLGQDLVLAAKGREATSRGFDLP